MQRIKTSLVNGVEDILLKITKVATRSLVLVPLLYLFCWLTGRHLPTYETFCFFFLGGLWFTEVSDKSSQQFLRFLHRLSRTSADKMA